MKKIEHQYFGQLNLAITDDVFEVKFGSGRLTENQKGRGFTEVGKNHSTIAEFHILRDS